MYFDAVIAPVPLGSPGIINQPTAGRKKLTKAQSRNDTDQPSSSRLTLGRPHTATAHSQPVSLLPPSLPRPRSSSNTPFRPPSIKKKKSMSFVSLFFNRNTQPSKPNTNSPFVDIEEKQSNIFKRSKISVEAGSPPFIPSRPRIHRLSRSFSSSPNRFMNDNAQQLFHSHSFSTPRLGATPSPATMGQFENVVRRSSEGCTNIPRTQSPSSALRHGVDGKGGFSAASPKVDLIDADAFYFDDDACSTVSSIFFADDPDEKPPNKGKGRESHCASVDTTTDVARLDRNSFVLDISSPNQILNEPGDITENEAQAKEDDDIAQIRRPPYRRMDKLLHILGESPKQHQQTHQRRHSCSTASVSSTPSDWSANDRLSVEFSPSWSLPDIPVVSPLTTTAFVPLLTTQPPSPTKSSTPTSSLSIPNTVKRKRRSTLLIPDIDGLTAFLKPSETTDTKRSSRPFRSSTFSSTSTPFSIRSASSLPPTPITRTLVPQSVQSQLSIPPGLDAHVQSCSYAEQDTENVDREDILGKSRAYRDSVMTLDSSFSDLHRLPSSLFDDSRDSQSIPLNTAPSTPTLLSCTSPLSISSASESSAQSPVSSFANTANILQSTMALSRSRAPSPTGTSTPTRPISHIPSISLSSPRSTSPPRHPLLSPRHKSSTRSPPSLSPLTLPPTASTGIELILDPVDSPVGSAVSPIVFACSDSDDYGFDRYLGDFTDDDSVEIRSLGSQDGIETMPLFEREKVGKGNKKANIEVKQKQRVKENSGWTSVRVPLRKKSPDLVQERSQPATPTGVVPNNQSKRETMNWVGEWNSDIHNVIQQLRALR